MLTKQTFVATLLCLPLIAGARGHGAHQHYERAEPYAQQHHRGNYAGESGVVRNSQGRIARSTKAKHDFKQDHSCPSTGKSSGSCQGYVIDHVVPLKRGGPDTPSNMQWQTVRDAKAKDRIE